MANVKKFVYVSTAAKWEENKSYITESTGKWYKSIVFRADTKELYNRGQVYGLSVADATRISDLESAKEALQKAQLATITGENVLSITDGIGDSAGKKYISSTLSLDYDSTNKKIQLKGIGSAVVAELDATNFIKDGMVSSAELVETAESGVTTEVPYIKITFNTDGGDTPVRFSVKKLVDVYTAANVNLTSAYSQPASYTVANIKSGASMDTVVGELAAGIADAKANAGVTSVGGKTGAITLDGDNSTDGTVNLAISESGEVSASIYGISNYAKSASSVSATGEATDKFVKVILGGTIASPTLTVTDVVVSLGSAVGLTKATTADTEKGIKVGDWVAADGTVASDGLVKATDVAKEIADDEKVIAEALNDHESRIKAVEGGSLTIAEVTKTDDDSKNVSVTVKTQNGSVSDVSVSETDAVITDALAVTTAGIVTSGSVTNIKNYVDNKVSGLDTTTDVTIASKSGNVVTLKAGVKETDGVIAQGTGSDITLAAVASTGAAANVTVAAIAKKTNSGIEVASTESVDSALSKIAAAIETNATSIANLDESTTSIATSSTTGENSSYVTITDGAASGSNDHEYTLKVQEAVYAADTNTYTTEGLVTSTMLESRLQDPDNDWEEL